jgi:sugar phosphate isomerase/epimerase
MAFHDKYFDSMDGSYSLSFGEQGIPTSPMTPVQIQELAKTLNMGVKNVEVGTISPENFETIPKQHFDEMRRLAKLSDAKISLHAPLFDMAGFTQQGWKEEDRKDSEVYFKEILDKAHRLDPDGNIPVVVHSTGAMVPGDRYVPDEKGRTLFTKDRYVSDGRGRKVFKKGEAVKESIMTVNQDTGQLAPLVRKKKFSLRGEKDWSPEEQLSAVNSTQWENKKLELASGLKNYNEIRNDIKREQLGEDFLEMQIRIGQDRKGEKHLTEEEKDKFNSMIHDLNVRGRQMEEFNSDLNMKFEGMVDDFRKSAPLGFNPGYEKNKEKLKKLEKEYKNEFIKMVKSEEREKKLAKMQGRTKKEENVYVSKFHRDPSLLFGELSQLSAPETFVSTEDFHKKKVSETVKTAAMHAYSKYGSKAPVIAIENMYGGDNVLSRADNLKDAIKESRKKFARELMKKKGLNKNRAKKVADAMIGATWDVGHSNMLRKHGFSDKEIVAEAKKIAPYVKHIHLTDNFGYTDSHLPLGMGNVPIKDQMKEMEKISESAKNARKIVESGAYAGQFKDNPIPYTLENMNSPVYAHDASPNWSQLRDVYGSYMYGFGDIIPDRSFREFGAGFAKLPKEVGGQMDGGRSKFANTQGE